MTFESHLLKQIQPSATLLLSAQAKEMQKKGLDVVNMTVGEPDFYTPEHIKDAAKQALDGNKTFYTSFFGIDALREEIVKYIKKYYDVDYQRQNTIVTCGAKQALFNALKATLNPNDEVIIIAPYWTSYLEMIKLCGGIPVICPADSEGKVDIKKLNQLINGKTKWLIINSPNNPSGVVYDEDIIKKIVNITHENQHLHLMCDDIYHQLIYEGQFCSPLHIDPNLQDRVLIINGFSKSCAMTGWRVGFAIGPEALIKNMGTVQSQSTSGICSIAQYAALAALQQKEKTQEFITQMNHINDKRRLKLIDFFSQNGFEFIKPNGAFYFLLSCQKYHGIKTSTHNTITNDTEFSQYLLKHHLISSVPGIEFGFPNYIRISYATSEEKLEKFMQRILTLNKDFSHSESLIHEQEEITK